MTPPKHIIWLIIFLVGFILGVLLLDFVRDRQPVHVDQYTIGVRCEIETEGDDPSCDVYFID